MNQIPKHEAQIRFQVELTFTVHRFSEDGFVDSHACAGKDVIAAFATVEDASAFYDRAHLTLTALLDTEKETPDGE